MSLILLPHSNAVPVYHQSPLLQFNAWELFFFFFFPQKNLTLLLPHHYLIFHTGDFINIYFQSAGFRYKTAAPPLITSDKAE